MITGDILGQRARLTPDAVALVYVPTRQEFTYAELDCRASSCAKVWLDVVPLRAGERVGILSENRVEYVDAFCAAGKSGIILVPLSTRNTAHELEHVVRDSGMRCLMYSSRFAATVDQLRKLAPLERCICFDLSGSLPNDLIYAEAMSRINSQPLPPAPVGPEDVYCLLYTSGTTGKPKGVMTPHRQIAWNAYNTAICWQLRETDTVQIFTPMYHAGGLTVFLTPLFAIGGRIVLHDGFDPAEVWRIFDEYRCTLLFGVPTIFKMLTEAPGFASVDFSRLRWSACGGAPLPEYIISAFQQRRVTFKQGYGLTEVGVNCFAMSATDSVRKVGSIGRPMMFTEAKLIGTDGANVGVNEVGELCLRGPHVCLGYWNSPAATAQSLDSQGWFHTGDLARRDEDGFFYIAGRLKEMIISGGVNIYPAEIEAELLQHPAVEDVAVIGVADEKWGEVPAACVVVHAGCQTNADELLAFLGSRLSKIKLPKRILFVSSLPRNVYGKVLRNDLRSTLTRGAGAGNA